MEREIKNRVILNDFLVQLNKLPGRQNHHSANNDKQKNTANDTHLPHYRVTICAHLAECKRQGQ